VEGGYRGGIIDCQWSDIGDGTASVLFGATVTAKYYGRAYLHSDTCCNHTVNAWTRTTY
jgi:hypothetical protein